MSRPGSAARIGLALTNADQAAITLVVERLRDHVPRNQTCSAGIAVHEQGEDVDSLMRRADEALYRAKHRGRNRALTAGAEDLGVNGSGRLAAAAPGLG